MKLFHVNGRLCNNVRSFSDDPDPTPQFEHGSFMGGYSAEHDAWAADPDVLAQVLAASQQEYYEALKAKKKHEEDGN